MGFKIKSLFFTGIRKGENTNYDFFGGLYIFLINTYMYFMIDYVTITINKKLHTDRENLDQ